MDILAVILTYLPQVIHLSLATSSQNRPWVCEVHFAWDDDLNLYFRSTPDRRHSREIAQNPHVAGTIVTQHHLGQSVRGVYFEGIAEKLADVTPNSTAYRVISTRFDLGPEILAAAEQDSGPAFYRISVSDWYVFDSYGPGPSAKHHLPWPKQEHA